MTSYLPLVGHLGKKSNFGVKRSFWTIQEEKLCTLKKRKWCKEFKLGLKNFLSGLIFETSVGFKGCWRILPEITSCTLSWKWNTRIRAFFSVFSCELHKIFYRLETNLALTKSERVLFRMEEFFNHTSFKHTFNIQLEPYSFSYECCDIGSRIVW